MPAIIVPDTRLETFYRHNPAFDIVQANLTGQSELAGLNWQDVEQAPTLEVLKQYQRLLRLYPDPAVAQALLRPMADDHAAQDTQPAPLHSAQAIAAIPQGQFVQSYSTLVGDPAIALEIHRNAITIVAKTQLLWANVQNLIASPHFRAMRVNNLDPDVYQFEDFPNYQELFGSLDYCQCDECQSIFGPAAYFVDLMRIIDRYITTPNAKAIGNLALDIRRPDLAKIELTCANTNDLLLYLDIVNTALEAQVVQISGLEQELDPGASQAQISSAAYSFLATAIYPFNLPFHMLLEQVRSYLGQLKVDLSTLYQTFHFAEDVVTREALRLSPAEYTLLTTANPDPSFLAGAYGLADPSTLLTLLSQEAIVLQQTGLSRQELSDLFTQNLSMQELQAKLAHRFYINQELEQDLFLPLAADLIPLSPASLYSTLDRLHRFIRLAHRLNWTFADLDWVLHSLAYKEIDASAIQDIAKIKRLQDTWRVPLDVLCSFWCDIKTIGVGTSGSSQALFDRVFNNPRVLGTQASYHPQYLDQNGQPLNPLYTDTPFPLPASNGRIATSLGLSLADFTALSVAFPDHVLPFTVQNLSVLYRHTQLSALLKLPMQQYLLLLQLMNKHLPVFAPDDLFVLLTTVRWLNSTGFNIYELDYILRGATSVYVVARYRDEDIQGFLQLLSTLSLQPQPGLVASDVLDWNTLVTSLVKPTQPGPAYRIWSLLSPDAQKLLEQMVQDVKNAQALKPEDQLALLAALNLVLQGTDFYQKVDFADLVLSAQVEELLSSREILSVNEWCKLNRLLLDAAFQHAIAQVAIQQLGDEWKEKLIQQLATFLSGTTDTVEALMEIIAPTLSLPVETGVDVHSYIEAFFLLPGQTAYTDNQLVYIKQVLAALSRALTLVDKMQLTSAEIIGVGASPVCYGLPVNIQDIALADLLHLSTFRHLTSAFQDTQNLLVEYFATIPSPIVATVPSFATLAEPASIAATVPSSDTLMASLAELAGWDVTQVREVITSTYFKDVPGLLTTVEGVASLKKVFDLSATLGADLASLQPILILATTSSEKVNWTFYDDAANRAIGLVKARYSDDAWTQIDETIQGALSEAQRSALSGYVLGGLGLKNLRALSEYLLIDVEMSGCSSISLIKQGLLSLQMYLQRCRMNLEPGVTTMQGIEEEWWEWMMSYRIWQANRKVFLYPENYLDPGLRMDQSDLFRELAAELLQSDITSDAVEAAYQHYFDKLTDLAKLRITESYRCSVPQPDAAPAVDTLFLFGRTATEPTTYYFRTCVTPTSDPIWTSWSKMDVRIQSDYISPVFSFGKLFVFWVETQSQTTSISTSKVTTSTATIKYTFQTLSGQWVQPQTLKKGIMIGTDPEKYHPSGLDLNTANLVWQKIYALDVPANGSNDGQQLTSLSAPASSEQLLLLYGSMFPSLSQAPDKPTDTTNAFDNQVYQALLQSFNAAQSEPQGYTSLLPATTLNGNLLTESTQVVLPFQAKHTTATLSQPRCWLAAVTVGSLALFAGGTLGGGASGSNVVDIYDAHTGKWSVDPYGLSQARSSLAATTVGSLAIFAGGADANMAPSAVVDIYDASATTPNKWRQETLPTSTAFPRGRANMAATSVGSLALFAGGDDAEGIGATASADLNIYDTQTRTWKTLTLSKPRTEMAATTVGSLAIFVGGRDLSGACNNVDIYDAASGQLLPALSAPGIPTAISAQAATSVGALALFGGGFTGVWGNGNIPEDATNAVNIYQTTTQQWTQATLKVARNWLAATSTASQAFFAGGQPGNVESIDVSDVCDVFDLFSQQWSTLQLSQGRSGLAATSVGSLVLFAGGIAQGLETLSTTVDIFDTSNVIYDNYLSDAVSTDESEQSEVSYLAAQLGLLRVKPNASIFTVKNQPGWFTFDNGDEAFLATTEHSLAPISENLTLTEPPGSPLVVAYNGSTLTDQGQIIFTRLTTSVVEQLSQRAFIGGIDHLLTVSSQTLPELDFARFQPWHGVKAPTSTQLDFQGAYGTYFQEIFFHIPFLIANTLNANQRFADAQKWYQYIFNPTQPYDPDLSKQGKSADRFWRYLLFRGGNFKTLEQMLTDDTAIKAYNDDPFDPDAIAQVRFGTYQKTIVMKYIDNLLDWGDALFAQDTWESITQATMLYLLAYDLLGPRPENLGPCPTPAPQTYADIKKYYGSGNIPQFLIELEQQVSISAGSASIANPPFNELNAYFGVSENDQFVAYWDRVEDRLYKIRHCENIAGVVQQLALFEPALNPMDLVRGIAAGNTPLGTTSGLTMDVPHYRFDALLERAKNITSTLIQLGASLLSALEKKDAEQLSLLRASQEAAILQLLETTRVKQISEAQASQASLNQSLIAATNRVNHYQGLLNGGLSANEQSSLLMMGNSLPFQTTAAGLNYAATVLFLLPTIFGLADGGMDYGQAVTTAASSFDGVAAIMNQQGALAAAIAQFARRTEDWQLELQMAQDDVTLITQQIVGAGIAVDIATTELASQQKSLEQASEIEDFLQRKFSGQDLYQWMVNRLADFYFQTFKLALETALSVQKAYQYELNSDETYIAFNYWDSLKQGLLAGEGLLFGLGQLEKAYLDGHSRSLEIEKTISLLQLDPAAFLQLKKSGKCQFQLSEKLFDYDFPGHYRRQIKTISLSIPAIVGPYQNINATLTQLSDQVLVQADPNGASYLLGVQGATRPDASVLRTSWRRNQRIALSRGMNDSGMFDLNFRDERYLPFEGTGAVSAWELSMPKATNRIDFARLSDVIIQLSYTALDAGAGDFTRTVQQALNPCAGAYYLNIKQTFPGAWHTLLSVQTDPTTQTFTFPLASEIIPPHLTGVTLQKVLFKLDVQKGIDLSKAGSFLTLAIGDGKVPFALDANNSAEIPIAGQSSKHFAGSWTISVNLAMKPTAILKNGFLDPALVYNMECILLYQGDIAWDE